MLAVGEALIDFIVADDATDLASANVFGARPGGAPANVAVALARLGLPAAFAGAVGHDPFGRRLASALVAEGVDVSRLSFHGRETSLAFAWKTSSGDGRFWLLRGADLELSASDIENAGVDRLGALIVGSVALSGEPSRSAIIRGVELAAAAGIPVCFDVNLRPSLWPNPELATSLCRTIASSASLLKLSVDDAAGLFDDASDPSTIFTEATRFAPEAQLVLTDGERGAWFLDDEGIRHVPVWKVAAIEPTGAGDAFTAALVKRLTDRSWARLSEADLQYAAAAGALATTKAGAWDGLPTTADLDSFLFAHGA
jgi:fructokinase